MNQTQKPQNRTDPVILRAPYKLLQVVTLRIPISFLELVSIAVEGTHNDNDMLMQ